MKQTNERLCALAQKGDAAALDSLIENNKSFIGKVANDLFRSMNLAQSGLNLDTDDLKQAGNLGLCTIANNAILGKTFFALILLNSIFSTRAKFAVKTTRRAAHDMQSILQVHNIVASTSIFE